MDWKARPDASAGINLKFITKQKLFPNWIKEGFPKLKSVGTWFLVCDILVGRKFLSFNVTTQTFLPTSDGLNSLSEFEVCSFSLLFHTLRMDLT